MQIKDNTGKLIFRIFYLMAVGREAFDTYTPSKEKIFK